jgi:hypothetical protein
MEENLTLRETASEYRELCQRLRAELVEVEARYTDSCRLLEETRATLEAGIQQASEHHSRGGEASPTLLERDSSDVAQVVSSSMRLGNEFCHSCCLGDQRVVLPVSYLRWADSL